MTWGLWLGLAVMGGCSVYYYPLFLLTMFLVPALWAVLAFRTRPVMLVVAGALVFLFGYMMGYDLLSCLCILGAAAPAGCVLYVSQKERMGMAERKEEQELGTSQRWTSDGMERRDRRGMRERNTQ